MANDIDAALRSGTISNNVASKAGYSLYPHADLSARQLDAIHAKESDTGSQLTTQMINAGRGMERPTETRKMSDPLAMQMKGHWDRFNKINEERNRRQTFHGSLKPIPRAHRQSFFGK